MAGEALLGAHDAQIKLGAAQGSDADTVILSGVLDFDLRALTVEQVMAQPLGCELAQREACADGPGEFFKWLR